MTDYSVKAPVLYGCGAIQALGERVRGFGAKKPMLICDPNLDPATYDKAVESVKAAGLDYVLFKETRRDAPIEVIDRCGEIALAEGADCLVGIGGGSTLDTAKATAILLSHPGPIKTTSWPSPSRWRWTCPSSCCPPRRARAASAPRWPSATART